VAALRLRQQTTAIGQAMLAKPGPSTARKTPAQDGANGYRGEAAWHHAQADDGHPHHTDVSGLVIRDGCFDRVATTDLANELAVKMTMSLTMYVRDYQKYCLLPVALPAHKSGWSWAR
jgi:hypothetical protein